MHDGPKLCMFSDAAVAGPSYAVVAGHRVAKAVVLKSKESS